MQVNLLSLHDVAVVNRCTGSVLLPAQAGSFEPLLRGETEGLRAHARPEDEWNDEGVVAPASTTSADVINEAERNAEHNSRTFRRQVAREDAMGQFRDARQGLREARQQGRAGSTSDGARGRKPGVEVQPDSRSNGKPGDAALVKARPTGVDSGPTPTSRGAGSSLNARVTATATSARAATSSGQAVTANAGNAAGVTGRAANPAAGRGLPGIVSGIRAAAGGPAAAGVKPSAPGASRGSAQATVVSPGARLSTKGARFSGVKANGSQAADNAARTANIERIVRLVAQRIRGERSHTVMRLDPPELGSLRLQMDLRGAVLSLRIDTSTQVAHRLLLQDVERLRHGLEASGIQLERIEVRPPTPGPDAGEPGSPGQRESEEGRGDADAEHPGERGKDSHPKRSPEQGTDPEPARESPVNLVA